MQDKLGPQCMKSLEDQVASIREAATRTLQRVASDFGPDWARDHLVPHVMAMIKNPHYLYRMTVLAALAALANNVPSDVLVGAMLPTILTLAKDKVWARGAGRGKGRGSDNDRAVL